MITLIPHPCSHGTLLALKNSKPIARVIRGAPGRWLVFLGSDGSVTYDAPTIRAVLEWLAGYPNLADFTADPCGLLSGC